MNIEKQIKSYKGVRKVWDINPKTRVKPKYKKIRREKDKIRKELKGEE